MSATVEAWKCAKICAAMFVLFAMGLGLYWTFSAEYGDGLEVTMEHAGVSEGESAYSAPLGYGENYLASFAMGAVGFGAVAALAFLVMEFLKRRK
ncbi:MAG: cobalt transporter [Candidatus Thermoplasmatota archaeon]|nr:cobalt transporter [Candidatus Thermoplasmatota archaeon]